MSDSHRVVLRRRGKEVRERFLGAILLLLSSPLFVICSLAIKLEGLVRPSARGPVFFKERRISRGQEFDLIKFRILGREALESVGPGPSHIAMMERSDSVTRVGRILKDWYLDELPQLWNIVRGDMFLIGTRPYPLELYHQQLERGNTLKRDMPAGLVGIVQASKGDDSVSRVELDAWYWEAFKTYPAWKLLLLDLRILGRSAKVQLEHKGI